MSRLCLKFEVPKKMYIFPFFDRNEAKFIEIRLIITVITIPSLIATENFPDEKII